MSHMPLYERLKLIRDYIHIRILFYHCSRAVRKAIIEADYEMEEPK